MEKSRAIELLKLAVPIKALTQQEYADFVEAVNIGMDALEQPTSPDTIDRKAALKALRKCQTYLYDARDPELKIELSSAEAAINNLPTIQPEERTEERTESHACDLIDRQAAINAVNNAFDKETLLTGFVRSIAVRAIRDMPSAQPEPHEGHWIKHIDPFGGEQYECSECGVLWEFNDGTPEDNEAYFCPKCGAKMKGVNHETD